MIRFHLTIAGTIPDASSLEEAEQALDFAIDSQDYKLRGIHIESRATKVERVAE